MLSVWVLQVSVFCIVTCMALETYLQVDHSSWIHISEPATAIQIAIHSIESNSNVSASVSSTTEVVCEGAPHDVLRCAGVPEACYLYVVYPGRPQKGNLVRAHCCEKKGTSAVQLGCVFQCSQVMKRAQGRQARSTLSAHSQWPPVEAQM